MAVNPKIHPDYQRTITGRLVKREPEMQRLPLRTEFGKKLREIFSRPTEGAVIVDPDYAAIELRIYADYLVKEGLWEPNSTETTTDSGSTEETPSNG